METTPRCRKEYLIEILEIIALGVALYMGYMVLP